MKRLATTFVPLTLATLLGCQQEQPAPTPPPTQAAVTTTMPAGPAVTALTLGNAVNADQRVTSQVEVFTPGETVFASVETEGTGPMTLRAVWSSVANGQMSKVEEGTEAVEPAGPAVHEFHASKKGGWPKGSYKVEIFLNDSAVPAQSKTFTVQ